MLSTSITLHFVTSLPHDNQPVLSIKVRLTYISCTLLDEALEIMGNLVNFQGDSSLAVLQPSKALHSLQ